MSVFTSIGHFFERLFGKFATDLEAVFNRTAKYINAALPIVGEIQTVLKGVDLANQSAVLQKIIGYIGTGVTDATAVQAFATANAAVPVPNILHNAAVFLTQYTHGWETVALSDIDTAVQVAYSLFKQNPAASSVH